MEFRASKGLIVSLLRPHFHYAQRICKKSTIANEGPLHGIKVLDLTRILAGPYCTMILGDLGAEVIKVEKPGLGDDTRSWGPPYINEVSCYFASVNRNKKSIALDLKKGKDILKKLANQSDVIVENFLPNTMNKIGLGYETLRKENPKLIYCTITGYGQSGPYVNRGGYDVIAASIGGLLHITGPKDGEPCKVGVAITDLCTGLYAHGAIMAAILQRQTTGKGQRIDCDLLSTQMACLANIASNYLNSGQEGSRWGTSHESIVPYQSFKAKDGRWLTIGTGNESLFHELCDSIGLSHFKTDPRFTTNTERVENRQELISVIQNILITKTCAEWLEIFKNCKFPYGPVNNMSHAFKGPQVVHNDIVKQVGDFKVVGPAVTFESGGNYMRSPIPRLGEHTTEILSNFLNYNESEIKKLYSDKIVQ